MRNKRMKLAILFSILSAGFIAMFWWLWCFEYGQEMRPLTQVHLFFDKWPVELPVEISRWWDILAGPIFSVPMVFLLTDKSLTQGAKPLTGVVIFGVCFLYLVPFCKIFHVPVDQNSITLALSVGLLAGLDHALKKTLEKKLLYHAIFFAWPFGLVYSLAYGLPRGLISYALPILALGLVLEMLFYVSRRLWKGHSVGIKK